MEQGSISESRLQSLVDTGAQENDYLEFKGGMYGPSRGPKGDWSSEQEFAKDVSAFANNLGGVIAIGIEECGSIAVSLTPIQDSDPAAEEQRLRKAIANYVSPPILADFIPVRSNGTGYYMLIVVPPSPSSPHAILAQPSDQRRSLRYATRSGADIYWLRENEVADRYRLRFLGAEERARQEAAVLREGREALARSENTWVYVAVTTEYSNPQGLNQRAVEDAWNWLMSRTIQSPLGQNLTVTGPPIPAPGRTTFTISPYPDGEDAADPLGHYVELYTAGHAFAASELKKATERGVGVLTLTDDCILLVDTCLKWAARQAGEWGIAHVHIGITNGIEGDLNLISPLELVSKQEGEFRRVERTRRVTKKPYSLTVVDLGEVQSLESRLVVVQRALAGLLQWFGLAEPAQFSPDGKLRTERWGTQAVRQWAQAHGLC